MDTCIGIGNGNGNGIGIRIGNATQGGAANTPLSTVETNCHAANAGEDGELVVGLATSLCNLVKFSDAYNSQVASPAWPSMPNSNKQQSTTTATS